LPIRQNIADPATPAPDTAALDALVQACGAGNRQAFEALYRATSARLYGICLHYLGHRAEAEEVLQEVYTSLWLKASLFDPALASAATWLATMARNKAIDRRRGRHVDVSLDSVAEQLAPDTVVGNYETECQGGAIDRCMATLEPEQRRYIRVAFFEGYSYAELAERYSVPLGTMKSWIRRGLLRLRVCLGL